MNLPPMNILVFTTLYPSAADPLHGVFVEHRLRQLLRSDEVRARVIAPVPWFPSKAKMFGRYATFARTPRFEERFGVKISHPRYLVLPRVGWTQVPDRLARAGLREAQRLRDEEGFDFDLIDAHHFFPDGVAASHMAQALGKPLVITARGTDLNVIAQVPKPKEQVLEASRVAGGLITVSGALADVLTDLGAEADKVRVLQNGVDDEVFHPDPDREALRSALGVEGPLVLSVGRLVDVKAHNLLVDALVSMPGVCLAILGDGPNRDALEAQARRLGVADRLRMLGRHPQEELARWYTACDVLALASENEGCPNVLLEALACGTPVVASAVGGIPEIVVGDVAGMLVEERSGEAFAKAIRAVLDRDRDQNAVLDYSRRFSWDATTRGQVELFRSLVA